jgi:S-methylmethionine-dependent homocysteine/selenocysteine methylase
MANAYEELLAAQDVLVLDGATGTELERRGYPTRLPLWTADAAAAAPDLLLRVHLDYLEAGADIVTANTFRTTPYTLRKLGRESEAASLTARSLALARTACARAGRGLVAGCLAPLEDCYHPERVPPPEVLDREHAAYAGHLAAAGADLLLVETMGTTREALAACSAALATGLPVLASFILDPRGSGALLSGEDLGEAVAAVCSLATGGRRVAAVLVNCTPPEATLAALVRLLRAGDPPRGRRSPFIGAYANLGRPDEVHGWSHDPAATPEAYATWARRCRDQGATLLGGCCGTTPAHIAALSRVLRHA